MPIKLNMNQVTSYTPTTCRTDDAPLTVHMRRVPPMKASKIKDTMYKIEGTKAQVGNIQSARLRMTIEGFEGWVNAVDEDGKTVACSVANKEFAEKERMFGLLPVEIQEELVAVFGNGDFDKETEQRLLDALSGKEVEKEDSIEDELASEAEDLAEEGTLQ